jgi:hypothetical protein
MNRWYHSGGRHQSGSGRGVPAMILLATLRLLTLRFEHAAASRRLGSP